MKSLFILLISLLVLLTSCTQEELVIKEAFLVKDKIFLLTPNDVIEVKLVDERSNYFFQYNDELHKFTYVCKGYSYGVHHPGDYIIYLGDKVPVTDDNGDITSL